MYLLVTKWTQNMIIQKANLFFKIFFVNFHFDLFKAKKLSNFRRVVCVPFGALKLNSGSGYKKKMTKSNCRYFPIPYLWKSTGPTG